MRAPTGAPGRVLVGRDAEFERSRKLLCDPSVRLVTFTGPPGVGKSCLAHAVATRLSDGSGPTAVVVQAEELATYDELLRGVAGALHLSSAGGDLESALTAEDSLAKTVLLLDGCLPAGGEPHPVTRLLEVLDGVRVLATSLAPLKMPGEQVVGLDPLPVSATTSEDEVAYSAAVQLFCRCAEEVDPWFAPDAADLAAVAALCHRVHGLPLGIELLAARVVSLSPSAILETLDQGLEVANERSFDDPQPHRHSVRMALDWSYRSLAPQSGALLRRMSVFESPATLDMLARVMAAVPSTTPAPTLDELLDLLGDLVDHRLVEPYAGPGEPAFGLVDLIRDFAAGQLIEAGEWVPVGNAHTQAMLDFVLTRRADLDAAADDVAQGELTRAERDLHTALRQTTGAADVCDGIRLTTALTPYVLRRGYDGLVAHPLAAMLRRAGSTEVPDVLLAEALICSARLAVVFEGPTHADSIRSRLAEGIGLARRSRDREVLLQGLGCVLVSFPVTRDAAGAVAAATEGRVLAEASLDPRWAARFCGWAGMIANQTGDQPRAVELAERGLGHLERSADPRAQLILGLLVAGLPDPARQDLVSRLPSSEELVATARRLRDRRYETHLLRVATAQAITRGDLVGAAVLIGDGLRLVERQASWHDLPLTTLHLVMLAFRRGDLTAAVRFHGTIREDRDQLRAVTPPWLAQRYEAGIEEAATALDEAEFEELVGQGARLSHRESMTSQLTYADRAAGRPSPQRPSPGRVPVLRSPASEVPGPGLTPREVEVLQEIVTGETNQEIGRRLGMAPKTVMHHTSAIYRKLGVRGRAEAIALAVRQGMAD